MELVLKQINRIFNTAFTKNIFRKKVQVLDEIDRYVGTILEKIILNFIYILGVSLAIGEQMTVVEKKFSRAAAYGLSVNLNIVCNLYFYN